MNPDSYTSLSIIGVKSVAAALNGLVYSTVRSEVSDLYALAQIDAFMEDPSFPLTRQDRRFALSCILVQHIKQQLQRLCAVFELRLPPEDETYQQAAVMIGEYAKTHNPELLGWCWLYYRYVRSELQIKATFFSRLCFISDRTLRRYETHAVQRLTNLLIQTEWQTRRARRSMSST